MCSYLVTNGGFDTSAQVTFVLEPEDFVNLVKNSKIDDIFLLDPRDPYLSKLNFPKRKECRIYWAVVKECVVCVTDPMGFRTIDKLRESINDESYYTIESLKLKSSDNLWDDEIGQIYESLLEMGYDTSKKIEDAFHFYEGHIWKNYTEFVKCKEQARKGKFRTFHELCTAKSGGFLDLFELEEARQIKASDKQTLEAYRLLIDLKQQFDLENLSESLVTGVVITLASRDSKLSPEGSFLSLDKIYYEYRRLIPEHSSKEFEKFTNESEIEEFLKSSKAGAFGHYNSPNKEFQYSKARIYIDGSNISFKGVKKGEKRKSLEIPDLTILENCYLEFQKRKLGGVKIYMDGNVSRKILKKNELNNRNILVKLQRERVLESSLTNEEADERLLQKMRDDPFAYIVVNDDYAKDHHLTGRDLERIINVKFGNEGFEFYGLGYESLQNLEIITSRVAKDAKTLFYIRKLGEWYYSESWMEGQLQFGECC